MQSEPDKQLSPTLQVFVQTSPPPSTQVSKPLEIPSSHVAEAQTPTKQRFEAQSSLTSHVVAAGHRPVMILSLPSPLSVPTFPDLHATPLREACRTKKEEKKQNKRRKTDEKKRFRE